MKVLRDGNTLEASVGRDTPPPPGLVESKIWAMNPAKIFEE
jgi:hypothetical protein